MKPQPFLQDVSLVIIVEKMSNISDKIKEVLREADTCSLIYLAESFSFLTNEAHTLFKLINLETFNNEVFLYKPLLRGVSQTLTENTTFEISDEEIILKTPYSFKRYPQIPSNSRYSLISLYEYLPSLKEEGCLLNLISKWQEIRTELKNLLVSSQVPFLSLNFSKENLEISTSPGTASSFSFNIPLNSEVAFYDKNFICDKEIVSCLSKGEELFLIHENNNFWIVIIYKKKENIVKTYFPLKENKTKNTVYINFDPLSFL